ncbi:MAG: acyl-CoA dehydrogenase [Pirellula sp.]
MTPIFPELPSVLSEAPSGTLAQLSIDELRESSKRLRSIDDFPTEMIRRCAPWENQFSSAPESLIRYYVWLAFGCLTTAFIMTQRNSAMRRIDSSNNDSTRERLLSQVGSGQQFATVGISQLSTSRRHLAQPPLVAKKTDNGWLLDGYCPWVTGAAHADIIVIGAIEQTARNDSNESDEHRKHNLLHSQMLFAVPTSLPNVSCSPGMPLIGLPASCTDVVRLNEVAVTKDDLLHGPCANVMNATRSGHSVTSSTNGAGGLQTSALAIGHAAKAIEFLSREAMNRPELRATADKWVQIWRAQWNQLLQFASGDATGDLVLFRKAANDLALQATQSALAAAKGAGFVEDHEVGRWCCEALFFLVWSCPQAVIDAHLCSLSEVR